MVLLLLLFQTGIIPMCLKLFELLKKKLQKKKNYLLHENAIYHFLTHGFFEYPNFQQQKKLHTLIYGLCHLNNVLRHQKKKEKKKTNQLQFINKLVNKPTEVV